MHLANEKTEEKGGLSSKDEVIPEGLVGALRFPFLRLPHEWFPWPPHSPPPQSRGLEGSWDSCTLKCEGSVSAKQRTNMECEDTLSGTRDAYWTAWMGQWFFMVGISGEGEHGYPVH